MCRNSRAPPPPNSPHQGVALSRPRVPVFARGLASAPPRLTTHYKAIANASPRDGLPLTELDDMDAAEVDRLADLGRACVASSWSQRASVGRRVVVLHEIAASIRSRSEELARLETLDCGKSIAESRADIAFCAQIFDYYAALAPDALRERPLLNEPPFVAHVVPSAVGLVACVTPWNYPLMQACVKVAPALAAGCAVLLKPSPLASLTCLELGRIAAAVGAPTGALSVITGGPPSGAADGASRLLSPESRVDKVSLTGSARAGTEALHQSARALRPTSLELGGKGAMIVFEDADMDSAVEWALLGIFGNAGQVCSATSRLLLHAPIAAEFTARLVAAANAIVVGDPLLEETQMGALISAERHATVLDSIASARIDGARVLCGGGTLSVPGCEGGWYVAPTILAEVPFDSAAWCEEIFGPVLALATFGTEREAVALANDSQFGLAHAVMTADAARAERVADALEAGTVWINCSQLVWPGTPFGGWKRSGFGREFGEAGLEEYMRYKTVTRAPAGHACDSYAGRQ